MAAVASSASSPTRTPGRTFMSVRFTERLDEIGARPSIGTVADSYHNTLAETTNGLYKTQCVHGPDPAALGRRRRGRAGPLLSWVHWFNEHRLPRPLRRHPAGRVRSSVHRCPTTDPAGVGNQ